MFLGKLNTILKVHDFCAVLKYVPDSLWMISKVWKFKTYGEVDHTMLF